MQFKSSVYIKVSKDEETAAPRISHSMVLRDEDPSGHSESRFDDGEDKTKLPKSIVELSLNQPPPSTHTIWRCHVCGNDLMSYATQIVCPKCSHQCCKACTMTIEPANTTAADIVSTNDSKIQTANNDMLDPEGLPNTTPSTETKPGSSQSGPWRRSMAHCGCDKRASERCQDCGFCYTDLAELGAQWARAGVTLGLGWIPPPSLFTSSLKKS